MQLYHIMNLSMDAKYLILLSNISKNFSIGGSMENYVKGGGRSGIQYG